MSAPNSKIKNSPTFVHLRLSSEYSLSEGILPMEQALELAETDHMSALAITDLGNIFGAVKFAKKSLKIDLENKDKRTYNIQPIIGCQLYIRNKNLATRQKIIALVKNKQGYHNLCTLLTDTYTQKIDVNKVALNFEELSTKIFEGLFILSGHLDGDIGELLLADQYNKAKEQAAMWMEKTAGNYFIELQKAHRSGEEAINEGSLAIADELSIPIVATHPIMFANSEDFDAHEVRYCIAHNEIFANSERARPYTPAQYFTTSAEMSERFSEYPQALTNTINIAKSCNFLFDFLHDKLDKKNPTYHLPSFIPEDGSDTNEFFEKLAREKLHLRLIILFPEAEIRKNKSPEYHTRLEYELKTIIKMGFAGYYLVVQEFINWAKNQEIPVGPGRGSGAGSIVAFVLGITDIDPIANGLLFERFLNIERVSMPDFDIDFCENRRGEVIDFVRERHGTIRVAGIVTYMTMAARAAIKDCGRALGVTLGAVNSLSELIPKEINITLEKAYVDEPLIAKKLAEEPALKDIWKMALKLEGLPRNTGSHAAGILITPKALVEYCPLYRHNDNPDELPVAQFDMKDIESLGLVKFDFLGLSTLTIIDNACDHIRKLTGEKFLINQIPENDAKAYNIFQSGMTNTIFQCESQVCKDLERQIKIENFEEITALMALNRPGPLNSGMVKDYINVKHQKEKIKIFDERIAEILKPTYGVIIYQEQVMQIAQILAKYSLGEADILRRAMGKKDEKLMAKNRSGFVARAKENNTNPKIAEELFNLIEKFAEYGFNKSHSAAYGLIAYQTAYLKAHYPSAFLSAVMSSQINGGSNNKIAQVITECKVLGIYVTPPSVNHCEYLFFPQDLQSICFGLGTIKGLGEKAAEHIVEIRKNGLYKNFDDFLVRVDRATVNKRALEALIKAGAFDCLDGTIDAPNGQYRQYYLSYIEGGSDENESTGGLFDNFGESTEVVDNTNLKECKYSPRQNVIWENQVLEFSWSGHLIDFYRQDLRALEIESISDISKKPEDDFYCWCAGIIAYTRMRKTTKGAMMSLILEDNSGARLDLAVFNRLLIKQLYNQDGQSIRNYLKEGNLIFVYGGVRREKIVEKVVIENSEELEITESDKPITVVSDNMPRMRAEEILIYDEVLQRAYLINLPINSAQVQDKTLEAISEFLETNKNDVSKINLAVHINTNAKDEKMQVQASYHLPFKISINGEKVLQLRDKLGAEYGEVVYSRLPTPEIQKRWQRDE